jgi:hypothetical protein
VEPAVTEYEVQDDIVADIPQLDDDESDPKVLIEDGVNNKDDEPVSRVRCLSCGCHDNDSAGHIIPPGSLTAQPLGVQMSMETVFSFSTTTEYSGMLTMIHRTSIL